MARGSTDLPNCHNAAARVMQHFLRHAAQNGALKKSKSARPDDDHVGVKFLGGVKDLFGVVTLSHRGFDGLGTLLSTNRFRPCDDLVAEN